MLNPNGFSAIMHSGWVQAAAGQPNEAINLFTRALRMSRAIHSEVIAN